MESASVNELELRKQVDECKTTMHIGVPADFAGCDAFLKDGGKLIIFTLPNDNVQSLEEHHWSVPSQVEWWRWQDDAKVQQHLFDRIATFIGGRVVYDVRNNKHVEAARRFCTMLQRVVELHNFDVSSAEFLMKDNLPTKNTLRNFRWIEDGLSMEDICNRSKGAEAFVIAAGPSLTEAIPHIRRICQQPNRPVLIAAGRCYRLLVENGLMPDLVMEVESFDWDRAIWSFAQPPHPSTILCFPLCVSPEVVREWPAEKCCLIDLNTQVLFGHKYAIRGGHSILHWMMCLGSFIGCDPITLIGADLGYPAGSQDTHADGTFPPWSSRILRTEHTQQKTLMLPANDGGMIQSSPSYQNFGTLAEVIITREGKKFQNASLHGLKITGTTVVDLATYRVQVPVDLDAAEPVLLRVLGSALEITPLPTPSEASAAASP